MNGLSFGPGMTNRIIRLKICGVTRPEDVRALGRSADGVVVGSALVEAGARGPAELAALVRSLRAATPR